MKRTVPDGTPMPSPPPPQPSGPTGPGRGDQYLRVAEVAEMFHVDRETVYRLVYDGELPWIDLRSKGARRARIRVAQSDAHSYMAARKHPARVA